MDSDSLLQSLGLRPFRPLPPFMSGHAQTLAALYWPQRADLTPPKIHEVPLPDGDRLVLIENRPASWRTGDRIAVLVHGLAGSHESRYMVRLASKLLARGVLVVRANLRGCGLGFGKARLPYHSGRSEDTRAVIQWLALKYPGSPVTQIGFSLGANLTLKMAGEDERSPSGHLDSIIAVSPPIDLQASAEKISGREGWMYNRFFVGILRREVMRLKANFPDTEVPDFPRQMTLIEFDDLYTAPRSGFWDAREYYRRASAGPLLSAIRVPTLILCAVDDPVLDVTALMRLPRLPGIDLALTRRGGHVGFLGAAGEGGVRWMDALILRWLEKNSGFGAR